MNKKLLPWLITFCALGLGGTAAYYSIIGLSKLFAGVATAVIIMASFLELSKLTLATLLHSYWNQLNKISKIYYIISLVILSILTSAGIYGMLSSGYQETANKDQIVTTQITTLETKKKLFEETRDNILKEKQSITNLQGTLSQASTTQYTDKNGNLVVRSNNAAVRNIESASKSNEKLSAKIDVINDSIFSIENKILAIKTNSTSTSELGPLKYISGLTGVDMDRIINWLLLVIIFVFDPLAIALVIAANFAFAQLTKREETPLEEKVEDMRKVVEAYDDLQDEMKEWEEASLTDLQDWYDEEENIPEPNEDLKQAAKEYEIYKEQDQKIQESEKKEDDWVIVDEDDEREKEVEASLDRIEALANEINSAEHFKKAAAMEEIRKLKQYLKSNIKTTLLLIFKPLVWPCKTLMLYLCHNKNNKGYAKRKCS